MCLCKVLRKHLDKAGSLVKDLINFQVQKPVLMLTMGFMFTGFFLLALGTAVYNGLLNKYAAKVFGRCKLYLCCLHVMC